MLGRPGSIFDNLLNPHRAMPQDSDRYTCLIVGQETRCPFSNEINLEIEHVRLLTVETAEEKMWI
jgi:hypothetical protein